MRDSYRWGTTRASSFQNVPSRYQMYCPSNRTASASVYSGLAVVSFQGQFYLKTEKQYFKIISQQILKQENVC